MRCNRQTLLGQGFTYKLTVALGGAGRRERREVDGAVLSSAGVEGLIGGRVSELPHKMAMDQASD